MRAVSLDPTPTFTSNSSVQDLMAHTPLDLFPQFDVDRLPPLCVLRATQPSITKARQRLGIYIEAPHLRPIPAGHFDLSGTKLKRQTASRTLGAYADIRTSLIYPRLTSFIEVEVVRVADGFVVNVHARHGNQESKGGSFTFDIYPDAFVHVAAWIWFATEWIGDSWFPGQHGSTQKAAAWQLEEQATAQEPFNRLLWLVPGEEAISEDKDAEEDGEEEL
jgi:hypothetical protein